MLSDVDNQALFRNLATPMTLEVETHCALCLATRPLRKSHLFPRFYFTRMRRDGGSRLRRPVDPNLVLQDGPKPSLLCDGCEQKFSKRESVFAREFFHPWVDRREQPSRYTAGSYYFAVSLLWRNLVRYLRQPAPESERWLPALRFKCEQWRRFLAGSEDQVVDDEIHMMQLGLLVNDELPVVNMNGYLTTALDMTVACGATACFVYAKMGMFAVIGWVAGLDARQWINTKMEKDGGPWIGVFRVTDSYLGAFLTDRARTAHELYRAGISESQQAEVDRRFANDASRIMRGILGDAIRADRSASIDPSIGRKTMPGRNEPCPCGSGVKFKRCHGV